MKLKIHEGKRYLSKEDGTPFFYFADTAWELFHKLTREEAKYYLETRKAQGFNAVQAVALAEKDGLRTPNAYGRYPLFGFDPEKPDTSGEYSYWDHMDHIIREAERLEMFITLLPTWGDKYNQLFGLGPEIFTPSNAYTYGKWLGKRYARQQNIIWMLGGDRPLDNEQHKSIIDNMAEGIKEGDKGSHLITFHPPGVFSSVDYVANKAYIDFHTIQSGHGDNSLQSPAMLARTAAAEAKPFMNAEPRYEDQPAYFNAAHNVFWDEADIRRHGYWDLMEGVCGYTYGNHSIWGFTMETDDYFTTHWKEALHKPGAETVKYLYKLRMSRDFFSLRPAPEIVKDDTSIMAHQAAACGKGYAYIYSPLGLPIRVYIHKFTAKLCRASWYNPRTGEESCFDVVQPMEALYVPPCSGRGNDWVLILDEIN